MKPPHIQQNKCECYCHTITGTGKACIACPDEMCSISTPTPHLDGQTCRIPTPHLPEYEIGYCKVCIQSTNHLNGVCQKCKQPEWRERFQEEFGSDDGHDYFDGQRISSVKSFISTLLAEETEKAREDERMVIGEEISKVKKELEIKEGRSHNWSQIGNVVYYYIDSIQNFINKRNNK